MISPPSATTPPPLVEQHVLRPTARWAWIGTAACAALAALDLVSGSLVDVRAAANVAGTLALAPTLTAIGGARRHVVGVGVLAVALALVLCLVDGVPLVTGVVSCSVVLVAAAVAAVVSGVRQSHLAQLQDRRQAAQTLQAALLTELPRLDHLQLASRYVPASSGDQVGGDWYDALVDRHGVTTLVIGDVTGHDIRAAASMGQVRAVLRAYAVEGDQLPSQLLARTESALDRLGLDVMATVVVVRVEPATRDGARSTTWSSAGHPPPLLLLPGVAAGGAAGGGAGGGAGLPSATPLVGAPDLMLGVVTTAVRHDHHHVLPAGATLLLHTDGLVERRGSDLDAGTAALCRALEAGAGHPLEPLLDVVLAQVLDGSRSDDVAVLALRSPLALPASR